MDKKAQLRKHKWFATMLFLFMAAVYVLCEVFFKYDNWAGYVKAFSEAAMVGALADWFAVVALFRHPLGIPIPHTNLIESSKKKIGNNLGTFVTDNFLTPSAIRPRLANLHIAERLGQWLLIDRNRNKASAEILRIAKEAIDRLDDADISRIIYTQVAGLVEKIPVHKLAGEGLGKIVHDNMHQDWITTLSAYLGDFLAENKELVKEQVKKESHFLIPGFVDKAIAEKITNGGIRYLKQIETDPAHPVRKQITIKLAEIAADIQQGGAWATRLENVKNELLSPAHLEEYSGTAWKYIRKKITDDLNDPASGIAAYMNKILRDMGVSLTTDTARKERIDQFVQTQAFKLIMTYKKTVGEMISQTVANWPAKQLSEKLELEVGPDLQFIRINGTLVGGTVGLLIFLVTKLLS
ncbi:MAG TPA: DUF445 family protein [Chitinophagaceae bacterium]|jgi:uncharacterized membrane-anchored protein YjiN (DUF445 family)|nr:DUF445 family protein [Chitinophagaceae bacterium]